MPSSYVAHRSREAALHQVLEVILNGMRPLYSHSPTMFRSSLSSSWTAILFQMMIMWEKQRFLLNPCLWKEAFRQLFTMWSRIRNIVEKSKSVSPSLQRRVAVSTAAVKKKIMVDGENLPERASEHIPCFLESSYLSSSKKESWMIYLNMMHFFFKLNATQNFLGSMFILLLIVA